MKLGFVSDFYCPSIGGTQMLCRGLAEWFRDQGHDIEIITSRDQNRENMEYVVNELDHTFFKNSNILLEKNYEAVFVFADLFSPTLESINTGDVKKTILVLNLDENVYQWIKEGQIKDIEQKVQKIKRFSQVVSFCQGAPVNKFLEENEIKYHFIPNFSRDVKNSPASNKITKESLGINKKIIFNHGLIETRKNQLNLMKSFLNSSLPNNYQLVLLGSPRSGMDKEYFLECKRLCDSNESITMIKGTSNQVVVNSLLNISDLYVLPSTAEGLPLVLLEAMSADLPWVSTPVGGVPSVFGNFEGGRVLNSFDLKDLEQSVLEVDGKSSRKDWESKFTIQRAGIQYQEILNIEEDLSETVEFLKKQKISFANQVYNEPEAIANYLRSCLQFTGIVNEVYIIDHRSSDNTLEVIKSFEEQYVNAGINLRWKTEPRDFSKDFTIADLFGDAVKECKNEIVFRHDADFIFGSGYLKTMELATRFLNIKSVYACGYEIPVVSDFVKFDENEVIDYGLCNVHVSVPRIFKRTKTECLQNHVGGKYEWFYPTDESCSQWATLPHFRQSLLSVNIKEPARQQLRETMNTFMEDLKQGKVEGNWLSNKNLRREKEEWTSNDSNVKSINIIGEKYGF